QNYSRTRSRSCRTRSRHRSSPSVLSSWPLIPPILCSSSTFELGYPMDVFRVQLSGHRAAIRPTASVPPRHAEEAALGDHALTRLPPIEDLTRSPDVEPSRTTGRTMSQEKSQVEAQKHERG